MQDNLQVLQQLLGKHLPEAVVSTASGGQEGLKKAQAEQPDVVLLDAKMPGMDGFAVCRELKKDVRTSGIPVLMISGVYVDAEHRVSGLESGADGYICKPYQCEELIAQVRALLRIKQDEDRLRKHEVELEQELEERSGELKASEARFRVIFESSPDAIVVYDTKGKALDANPAAQHLYGMDRAELLESSFGGLFEEDREEEVQTSFEHVIEGNVAEAENFNAETRKQHLALDLMMRHIDYAGKPAVLVHARDITERKRIEDALREVARGVSKSTGFSFFFSLVQHLSRALDVDYVLLVEKSAEREEELTTLAVSARGELVENFSYAMRGSPCEDVMKMAKPMKILHGIRHRYPRSGVVEGWDVDSYIGAPLLDSSGNAVGVLAVLNRQAPHDPQLAESLLQVFAARAASELDRKKAAEELWESEEKYRSLTDDVLDTSSIGTVIFDSASKVVWVNQSFERFFGVQRSAVMNRSKKTFLKKIKHAVENADTLMAEPQAVTETSESEPIEYHVLPGDERAERWLEHWSQPIRTGLYMGGRIDHYADITERKRVEQKLRASEALLRRQNRVLVELTKQKRLFQGPLENALRLITEAAAETLQVARVGIWLFEEDNAVLKCRDVYVQESGEHVADSALVVKEFPVYFEALEQVRTLAATDALSDPRTASMASVYLDENHISSLLDAPIRLGGKTLGVVCHEHTGEPREWAIEEENFAASMADVVTLAIESREHLRTEAERDRLAMAMEQTVEAVVITDTNGIIQYVNPAFAEITGYDRDEAIGSTPRMIKSGEHDEDFYREMWETLHKGGVWAGRITNRCKDGSLYQAELVISSVRDAHGEVVNYIGVSRDITHEIELEEQFRQAQKMENVGRLAGGIAHDFNNLLTSILGFSRLIQDSIEEDHPVQADIREIVHAGERAAKLTRQLLAFGRKQIMQIRALDLNEVVMEMDQLLRRTLGEDVELVTVLGEELGTVEADAGLLEQIIMNLAVNARDAMPKGGKLTIETRAVALDEAFCSNRVDLMPGDYVLLAVKDIGMGMPDEVVEHAFEPFFTTKEKGKGTGLGLATVYGIVKQLNGHVEIDSELDVGTSVSIYLSRADIPKQELPRSQQREMPGGSETILVVEDEDTVRHLTVRMLKTLGYHVLEARHGGEALLICERYKEPIDMVLTDVVMPHVGGHELMKRLHAVREDLKVLYISGFTEDRIIDHGVGKQGVPLLLKPYTSEALAQKVRDVLDG